MIKQSRRLGGEQESPAPWLRTVQTSHATLVVDYRTGEVTMLGGEAMRLWNLYVAGQQPELPNTTVETINADFSNRGWFTVPPQAAPAPVVIRLNGSTVSWGTQETAAALPAIGNAPWPWRLAALPIVLLVLLARQSGRKHRFARLVRLTQLGAQQPWATDLQARHAVRAVRHVARYIPARIACLEESMAAKLLLAAIGKRATWCHGIATDPVRLHAWIAGSDGDPIDEPPSTHRYTMINHKREGDR
jgi:hypothetical protein